MHDVTQVMLYFWDNLKPSNMTQESLLQILLGCSDFSMLQLICVFLYSMRVFLELKWQKILTNMTFKLFKIQILKSYVPLEARGCQMEVDVIQ